MSQPAANRYLGQRWLYGSGGSDGKNRILTGELRAIQVGGQKVWHRGVKPSAGGAMPE
jgi:hypothetical protein